MLNGLPRGDCRKRRCAALVFSTRAPLRFRMTQVDPRVETIAAERLCVQKRSLLRIRNRDLSIFNHCCSKTIIDHCFCAIAACAAANKTRVSEPYLYQLLSIHSIVPFSIIMYNFYYIATFSLIPRHSSRYSSTEFAICQNMTGGIAFPICL